MLVQNTHESKFVIIYNFLCKYVLQKGRVGTVMTSIDNNIKHLNYKKIRHQLEGLIGKVEEMTLKKLTVYRLADREKLTTA